MAVTLGQMDWRLGVDNADFQRGLSNAENQAKGFGSKITGLLSTGAKVAFGAAVVGVGALGAVLAQSVKEASAAEEVTAQLNAVIKSTGWAAGRSAKQIQELALGLSKTTRFEDDAIVGAESLLLTFTKITGDVFPKATALTLDLATAMKMDLKSAALMMGKALNDPVAGLTAMSRAGVQFTKQQKAMIKAMVEAGDVAGAQRVIMAELETQVGGSAKAAGETMAGQMDIMKNALGNVKEEIGGALIPIVKDLITWIGPKLTAGLQKFSDWFRTGLVDVQQFAGKLGKAKDMIGDMIADVSAGEKIKWQDLMNLAGLFTNQVDIQRKFATIATDIQNGITSLKTAFDTGGLKGVFDLAWKSIGDWWDSDAIPFATELGGKVQAWWTGTFLPALAAIDWASIGAAMQSAWDTLRDWWTTEAVPFATQVADSITTWFTGQVIPVLQTQAPLWGAKLAEVLKSIITVNGNMIGNDANLAYILGSGFVKLLISSLKALSIGPTLLFNAFKSVDWASAFSGDANLKEIFGDIFGPIADFLLGALDTLLLEIAGDAVAKITAWWNGIWESVTDLFNGPTRQPANVHTPIGPTGGRAPQGNYGGTPVTPPGGTSGGRAMSGTGALTPITVNVYAAGGGPEFVRKAANVGVNEALRARGYR